MAIELANHLAYSPNLNLIENLWKLLKAKIIKLHLKLVVIKDSNAIVEHLVTYAKKV